MNDYTWQAVIVTLIVQAAAVGLAYVNRNRHDEEPEDAPATVR